MFQRRFLSLSTLLVLGILLLPFFSSAQTSNDTNFSPSPLATGLSNPANGVVFRPSTGDLVVSQYGASLVSLVNATSGAISPFASQATPDEVAVRASDGLVAVKTHSQGPIDLYNSNGTPYNPQPSLSSPASDPTGLAFDGAGNLYMADSAGLAGEIWKFSWSGSTFTSPTTLVSGLNPLEGLVFSAAPLPLGSLYAISQTVGTIYQIPLGTATPATIATVSGLDAPVGIAIDPLLGDIYTSQTGGSEILRVPPGGGTPTTFATGFTSTYGLGFDTVGNLYVNDFATGILTKFTRASSAPAAQTITPGTPQTFINPAFNDQTQMITIPTTANLNGAVTLQDIFVQVDCATLNARLNSGSAGDTARFGGGPVPAGTVCVPIPSGGTKSLVIIQKCRDVNGNPFDICPVQGNGTDLIQLATSYNPGTLGTHPPNSAFLIDYDQPPSNQTLTDITTSPFDCCTGSGGTKGLCSQTIIGDKPPVITIATPRNNAAYALNLAVASSYACTDPQSQPSGYPTCTGTAFPSGTNIDTGSTGTKTFTVSSTDSLGASANKSVTYTVVSVSYNAFIQQPINPDGSSVFKASKGVIPVKFTLTQNNVATCALPAATIALTQTSGGTLGAIDESVYLASADSGSNFRISSCQYVYNLAASSLGAGTYRVDIIISGTVVGGGVFALK